MKRILVGVIILLSFYGIAVSSELVYVRQGFHLTNGMRVAVAPFQNLTQARNAGNRLANDISQFLRQKKELYVIRQRQLEIGLKYAGLKPGFPVDRSLAQKAGRRVRINYVIFGSVVEYGYELASDGTRTIPIVGVDIRIMNVNSGRIVFAGSFVKEGSSGEPLNIAAMNAVKSFYKSVR